MDKTAKNKKIIMTGGGTGGSVIPLLVVAEELLKDDKELEFVFVGTKNGPEKELIEEFSQNTKAVKFISLLNGKWRRYFSFYNISDVFKIGLAFCKSLAILKREKPDLVISAGSFVSVPLVWAAGLRKIPVLIHQQDVRPGLANKLMAPWAKAITVTFEKSLIDYGPRAAWVGNPINQFRINDYRTRFTETREKYNLSADRPVVLIIGGGTGAVAINELIFTALDQLIADYQIIHLTGKGKKIDLASHNYYQSFEFLTHEETLLLMAAADLVISRCGLGVLTELSTLAKPAILIPIPNSHQEDNAQLFKKEQAAIVLDQNKLTAEKLLEEIKAVLADNNLQKELSIHMAKIIKKGAASSLAGIIWEMLEIK